MATLQEMNPFVKVAALPGTPAAALKAETLRQADVLLLCGQDASVVHQADALCREDGVAFFAGLCRGIFGWGFADLGEHRYTVEVRWRRWRRCAAVCCGGAWRDGGRKWIGRCKHAVIALPGQPARALHSLPLPPSRLPQKREEQADGSTSKHVQECSDSFASFADATSCSLRGASVKRLSKLYLVLRGKGGKRWGKEPPIGLRCDVAWRGPAPPAASPTTQHTRALLAACAKFEQQNERFPTAEDAEALRQLAASVCQEAGVDPAALPDEQLQVGATGRSSLGSFLCPGVAMRPCQCGRATHCWRCTAGLRSGGGGHAGHQRDRGRRAGQRGGPASQLGRAVCKAGAAQKMPLQLRWWPGCACPWQRSNLVLPLVLPLFCPLSPHPLLPPVLPRVR